ncbi:MAG: metallophosphoesterase family protein, partial [Myxococcaceae bacterium]
MRTALLLALCLSASSLAQGEPPRTFAEYEAAHAFECNGPLDRLPEADVVEHGGLRYELQGSTARVRKPGAPSRGPVKVGVLSGIKDLEPETREALLGFFAELKKQQVQAVLIGGDTAEEPGDLEKVYGFLVEQTDLPLLAIAGNSERGGAHNYAIQKARAGHPNLLNMDIVRRFDGEGFDVVALGGYYDKKFMRMAGGCAYGAADVATVGAAAKECDDPVIFLAHGPPRQRGQAAIDYVPEAGNVGDLELTEVIKAAGIPFGVFGHILEAGGKATDLGGAPLAEKKLHKALYLNPGSANPLPWKLNSGQTSHGLAAVLTVEGKQARYELLRAPKKAPPP